MIRLAFLWHFHQPSYHDLAADRLLMPWVRIHGAKDYPGMAALLEEYPGIRCTANFSPCLLDQLAAYGRGVEDEVLHCVRKDPDALDSEERKFLRRQLFYAHPDRHIGAHPRYAELQHRERAGEEYSRQDWIDLETLNALVWLHPTVVASTDWVRDLLARGRHYRLSDRDRVLGLHLSLVAGVVPRWKALQDAGRVEISVSPYYHPIVPLLCDGEASRVALPELPSPPIGRELRADADLQVRRARARAEELFGRAPAGCWPSEGSVSPEACDVLADAGFRWFATDQAIHDLSGGTTIQAPHPVGDGRISGVFRDSGFANLLGFVYKSWDPVDAADDFIRRVEGCDGPGDRLVVVALDGENAWEHYPENGIGFFRRLYERLSAHPTIRTSTVGEGIEATPAGNPLRRIWSGSWINANYGVWMGHEEDRRAWDLVARVRRALATRPEDDRPATMDRAWECLYQAEGSDWTWWFGEDFSTPQDAEFDALFRLHLRNACKYAGVPVPPELYRPLKGRRREDLVRQPWALLDVAVDGRRSDYFEWISAGHYDLSRELGAMSGDLAAFSDVYFGSDGRRLLLRLDVRAGVDPAKALGPAEVRLVVTKPGPRSLALWPAEPGVEAALGDILEAAVPIPRLGAGDEDELEFHLEVRRPGAAVLHVPSLAPLTMKTPAAGRQKIDWQV